MSIVGSCYVYMLIVLYIFNFYPSVLCLNSYLLLFNVGHMEQGCEQDLHAQVRDDIVSETRPRPRVHTIRISQV